MSSLDGRSNVAIEVLPPTASSDRQRVGQITDLVNEVYAVAEAGMWVDGASRTNADEIAEIIAARELAIARRDGNVVGSVRIQQLDDEVGEFGMLVADPAHRNVGIGRALIGFAEAWTRERGNATMQLELLVPREWSHPTKDFLHAWYTRIGYRPVRSGNIEASYPHLAPLLATPCDFVVYHKPLTVTMRPRQERSQSS